MHSPMSRLMSTGTAAYAVFALARPRHLGDVLTSDPTEKRRYDLVATTYGCRDLAISAVALLGRSPQAVRAAMLIRIGLDLADCAVLTPRAETPQARTKVAAVTATWAGLNALAVLADRRPA